MRQLAAIAALWGCVAVAQAVARGVLFDDDGTGAVAAFVRTRDAGVVTLPAFAFATSDGGGLSAACTGDAIFGTRGEPITFRRDGGGAYCSKSDFNTPAIGDLVWVAADKPRVMPGANGYRGLLVEALADNWTLQSSTFGAAPWQLLNSGAAAPTLTVNVASPLSPIGTQTASRLQVPATTGAEYSILYQNNGCNSGTAASIYVYGNGVDDGGIQYRFPMNTANDLAHRYYCPVRHGFWQRCKFEQGARLEDAGIAPAMGTYFLLGNDSVDFGIALPAMDVFIWHAQCENPNGSSANHIAGATSPIPTTTGANTRYGEFADADAGLVGPAITLAASALWSSSAVVEADFLRFGDQYTPPDDDNITLFRWSNTEIGFSDNKHHYDIVGVSAIGTTAHRVFLEDPGDGGWKGYWDGVVKSSGALVDAGVKTSMSTARRAVAIGRGEDTATPTPDYDYQCNCVVNQVCISAYDAGTCSP